MIVEDNVLGKGAQTNGKLMVYGCGSIKERFMTIPHNCHGHHGRCPCKNILSGVKFSRLNTKTAYILLFRDIFQCFEVFLVNFWVQNLELENAACVKEITNIRYGYIGPSCTRSAVDLKRKSI